MVKLLSGFRLPDPGNDRLRTAAMFSFIVLLVLFVYSADIHNTFLEWDDLGYTVDTLPFRPLSLETVRWAFGEYPLNSWTPLTWISLAVDHTLWGLAPSGFHLTNNILHALNTGMFFLLLLRLQERYRAGKVTGYDGRSSPEESRSYVGAVVAALLFGLHPLRVESVAWISERKDVLSLFFGLPALLFYVRSVQTAEPQFGRARPTAAFMRSPYYWMSLAAFGLSLLSKPMLVTLPLVLLVLDWFPLGRFRPAGARVLLVEKVPFLLFSLATSLVTMAAQRPLLMSFDDAGLLSRVLIAARSTVAYVRLTLWPSGLSPFYLHPGNVSAVTMEYLVPSLLVAALTAACVAFAKRYPIAAAVWLIYLITLVPVIGIAQVGPQAMAARYTYVPGLPLSLFIGLGVSAAWARTGSRPARVALIGVLFAVIIAMTYQTVRHIGFWKDDVTLWTRAIDLQPHHSGRAYFQRGHAYVTAGDHQRALADLNEALAIASRKGYRQTHTIYAVRARARKALGDRTGAIDDYSAALTTGNRAERASYHYQRGTLYQELGKTDLAAADFAAASGLSSHQ